MDYPITLGTLEKFCTHSIIRCNVLREFWQMQIQTNRINGNVTLTQTLKKKAQALGSAIIFEDEASFRQDSTMHATWSKRGNGPTIPVTGKRNSVKIFGCVDIKSAKFNYHCDEVFNAETYLTFLEQIAKQYYGQHIFLYSR